ncbi:hypothetical protein D3C72_1299890 [compost metagenome]
MLTFSRDIPVVQRGEDRDRRIQSRRQISNGDPDLLWPTTRLVITLARYAHQPAFPLENEVVAGAVSVRPGLAVPGDRAIDQARIDLFQTDVVKPSTSQITNLKVLYKDVALKNELTDQIRTVWVGDVHANRSFVPICGSEVGGILKHFRFTRHRIRRPPLPRIIPSRWVLNLDDIGSHVAQHLGTPWPCEHSRHIQYANVP